MFLPRVKISNQPRGGGSPEISINWDTTGLHPSTKGKPEVKQPFNQSTDYPSAGPEKFQTLEHR